MHWLEHRIPPPVVGALIALAVWSASTLPPLLHVPGAARVALAAALALVGASFDVLGLVAFRRARTTVNPLHPGKAAILVTGGVYRRTRNPMYVGMSLLLLAWAVYLDSAWALLGPAAFVAYITRFQIVPEERALRAKFPEFDAYASGVRRWL